MKYPISLILLLLTSISIQAQSRYWVFLDEAEMGLSPASATLPALSPTGIERRIRQGIPLKPSDFPVPAEAIARVQATGAQVYRVSRWFRAVTVYATEAQLAELTATQGVRGVQPVARMQISRWSESPDAPIPALNLAGSSPVPDEGLTSYSYGQSLDQVSQINLIPLHDAGYTGLGVNVALMDGGFSGVESHACFTGAWNQNRIVLTHDFVDNDSNVFQAGSHGMSVLSTICSDLDGTFIGTAPEANYFLFRTEDEYSETLVEEDNWVVAAEWADSLGVDVINTSLGYTTFDNGIGDHSYADLDGRTAVISRAATAAARTGMIVVVAAGNEGSSAWKYISCPADADSIFSVGAVDGLGVRAGFSSQGPTADGRTKPDIATRGSSATIMKSSGMVGTGSGTSFASPIACGAMACLVQAHKSTNSALSIQDLMNLVRSEASQASKPDSLLGWGIPNFGSTLAVMGIDEPSLVPEWSLRPQGQGYALHRTRPTGMTLVRRYDFSGRLLEEWTLSAGTMPQILASQPMMTFLQIDAEEPLVLKVPAF
ncbi:S8 family serine peptidase [Schleiferiaceae bacterium]|nr:S8 family serine peptidase [Schleiferiaceae bacterium]